jgi:hypothetical protein
LTVNKQGLELTNMKKSLDNLEYNYGLTKPPSLTYDDLCSDNEYYRNFHKKRPNKLSCRLYTNNNNPFLILAPAKEEQIYENPYIYIYHNSNTDKQSEIIKNSTLKNVTKN